MLERRYIYPGIIEMNYQAGHRLGCNIYLIDGGSEWLLIDVGYEDTVDEIIDLIRQMDFPLAACKTLIATHADADHVQGMTKAQNILKTSISGHPLAVEPLASGDPVTTYAEIKAQNIFVEMKPCQIDTLIDEGDIIQVGDKQLEVWHTPGHTNNQLALRMDNLLMSGDNIYRDGCVGAIDAHHGSDIPDFIQSLKRIRDSDISWLLPSHGPIFKKENALLEKTIERLSEYQFMSDFGTCAVDWPLLQAWDREITEGHYPKIEPTRTD